MLIPIDKIKIPDRIRKDLGDIKELANDIKENGLISPPVVTPNYELIAGERRLKAMQYLGYQQIEVRSMDVTDYEHMLNLEISENENRKDFTKVERLDYARRLENIERMKATKRMTAGTPSENFREGGRTADIVADKLGFGSGRQYEKEKYIAAHADEEMLEKWNKGDISTHKAYMQLKKENEALQEKIAELENRSPKIKTVEKTVYPKDYHSLKSKVEQLNSDLGAVSLKAKRLTEDKDLLERKVRLNEKDVRDYGEFKKQIEQLKKEKSDISRQIEAVTELSGLVVKVELLLKGELAPIKYSRAISEQARDEIVVRNLTSIVDRVEEWCHEMRTLLPGGSYIDAEVIDV